MQQAVTEMAENPVLTEVVETATEIYGTWPLRVAG